MPRKPEITNASDALWSAAVERERVTAIARASVRVRTRASQRSQRKTASRKKRGQKMLPGEDFFLLDEEVFADKAGAHTMHEN
jgi:hypothetical protein